MQKVTNLGHFVRNRLPSAQNVPLRAVRAEQGRARSRRAGRLLVVRGPGPSRGSSRVRQWLARAVSAGDAVCWGVAHSFWGAGRGGGVVPTVSRPRGTSGNRMNVQRSPRCTFILVPGPGPSGGSSRFCHLLIAVCRKNVQLRQSGQLAACPRSPTGLSLG